MARVRKPRPTVIYRPESASKPTAREQAQLLLEAKTRLTLVILGTPRGGTTMIAGLAQRCGVDIGENLPDNLEDPDFAENDHERIRRAIRERNRSKSLWGWKFPRAAAYLEAVQEKLVNPHYVIVWRDIYSASLRRVVKGEDQIAALNWAQSIQRQNLDLMKKLNGPVLLISYARAIAEPSSVANDICDFIDVQPAYDITELHEFTQPGSYKTST